MLFDIMSNFWGAVQNDVNCTHDAEETAYFLRRTGY